jgi:hypothetical protein
VAESPISDDIPPELPVAVKVAVEPSFLLEFRQQADRERKILKELAQRATPTIVEQQRRLIIDKVVPHCFRPYQIAFMGNFSAGKTYLINRLLIRMQGHNLEPYTPQLEFLKDSRR